MIKITVDEAYAFDYYSILHLKYNNGYLSLETLQIAKNDLIENLGNEIAETILASDEYKEVYEANKLTFDAVDKAKDDSVPASYVDKCNYKRMLAKKELQSKFFNTNLSEIKIGYERHK
jgi:hypothetical protein